MADLEPLLRFWRAHDDLFEHTQTRWWGAVVADARFPAIQEPNYARVETRQPVRLEEIDDALVPAMRASGSERSHVVIFHPEDQTDLIATASTRGDRIAWDLVMMMGRDLEPTGRVEEISAFDGPFWVLHRDSARLVLEATGFVDHVVTFPDARRRGHAEALTRRIVSEATAMGAERTYLLAEPEGGAVRIYDRIGFERVAHFASWLAARDR